MQRSPKPWYEGAMFVAILSTVLALLTPVTDREADAFRSTAPTYLTLESAREHLHAARIASEVSGVDSSLLLAIAYNESRYQYDVVSNEPGNQISCGVMTPVPMHRKHGKSACDVTRSSPLAGYLAGAWHVRGWIEAARGDLRTALIGVAGGYVGINYCASPESRGDYRCATPDVFRYRARMIQRALARAAKSTGTS